MIIINGHNFKASSAQLYIDHTMKMVMIIWEQYSDHDFSNGIIVLMILAFPVSTQDKFLLVDPLSVCIEFTLTFSIFLAAKSS